MNSFKRANFKARFILSSLLVIAVLIIIYAVFFFGSPKTSMSNDKKIKIGLSMDSLVVERWSYDRDIFVAKAKQLGAEVIVQDAGNDSNEQINQIKFLIDQGVKVLVIVPNDWDALTPIVKQALRRGIKVICYDRIIRNANTNLYVSFDNENVGEMMASAIVKKVPRGKYIIINGSDRDNNAVLFNNGFKKVLNPYIRNGDIKIVKEVWAKGWKEEDAYSAVESVLSSGVKINGIIAANDRLAEAAIQILAEHRLAGKVAVVGEDAALAGCQRVAEGTQLMTVYKPLKKLAQNAAEAAVKLAKGEKVETNQVINDGTYNIPIIMEKTTAVDKNNLINVIVKNNFHTIEDIYRNIPKSKWPKIN